MWIYQCRKSAKGSRLTEMLKMIEKRDSFLVEDYIDDLLYAQNEYHLVAKNGS